MKRLMLILMMMLLFVGCSDNSTDSSGASTGRLVIELFDSPPPPDVEKIYLTITDVRVHNTGSGWLTIVEPDTTFDFLELVNGVTAVLADVELPVGKYTQLRLVVADTNEIVIDGVSYPLIVPSGTETGVKLNLGFTLEPDQLVEIYVDFDASKSITWNPDRYLLRPSFRAFAKVVSAVVSGVVRDELDAGIANALVTAVSTEDSASTLTDNLGQYRLVLRQGIYDISASASGYSTADTTYTGVEVDADLAAEMVGYDFVLK